MFFQGKKKNEKKNYDKEKKCAVLKCSICNGEQVAGFKDIRTGKFEEIMLIKTPADLEKFKEQYGVEPRKLLSHVLEYRINI